MCACLRCEGRLLGPCLSERRGGQTRNDPRFAREPCEISHLLVCAWTDSWGRPKVVCAFFSNRGPGAVWAISQALDLICHLYSCQTMQSAAGKNGKRTPAKGKAKGKKRPARKSSASPGVPTRSERERYRYSPAER